MGMGFEFGGLVGVGGLESGLWVGGGVGKA